MSYLSPNLTNLIAAVKKAAASLARDFTEIENLQSSVKDYRNFVMNGYNKADRTLRTELSKMRPNFAFAEDGKPRPQGGYFVVSTISGMTNFVHAIPYFSVSVAMCENNTTLAAVIYNPVSDELFFAEKGKGAFKEGFRSHERLRVSARAELEGALIAVKSVAQDVELSAKIVNNTLKFCHDVRASGAVALDLAYVAAGKLDGVIAPATMQASMAAGILLVKEAGGMILDMEQEDTRTEDLPKVLNSGNLMASSFNLSQKIAKILK